MIAVTDTARGGTPLKLATVARGTRERGWEVAFVSLMPAGDVLKDLTAEGFLTLDLKIRSPVDLPGAVTRTRRLIRRFRPAVVQTALFHANLIGRLAAIGTGVRVINGHESVDDDKPRWQVALDRLTLRLAIADYAISANVADRVVQRDRIPRRRITVIPVGTDLASRQDRPSKAEARARFGIPGDSKVVAWTGRMHPVKDLPVLFNAVGRLPGWWLLLGGDGEERVRIESWTKNAGLDGRVVAPGMLDDVVPLLAAADVFCLPSKWEGLPAALLEAMAIGLPVVASRVGGIPELVTDGENGILVNRGDATAFAAAIEEAARRTDLGERAAATVQTRFSLASMLDAFEKLWLEQGTQPR